MPALLIASIFMIFLPGQAFSTQSSETLNTVQANLASVHSDSWKWQWGWTGLFSGAIVMNALKASSSDSKDHERFDARVSLVTSGSGLLSMLINPLEAADISSWHQLPETNQEDIKKKIDAGKRIIRLTNREIERRQSLPFYSLLLGEQIAAAAVIAYGDHRPQDALRRLGLGILTSFAWVITVPKVSPNERIDVGYEYGQYQISYTYQW